MSGVMTGTAGIGALHAGTAEVAVTGVVRAAGGPGHTGYRDPGRGLVARAGV
jgi:hypothetical protein